MVFSPLDLIGKRFGKLLVISKADFVLSKSGRKRLKWTCKCDCGTIKSYLSSNLSSGTTKSCGCSKLDYIVYPIPSTNMTLSYYGNLKRNAKKRDISFNVTIDYLYQLYLSQNKKCALTGVPIDIPSFTLVRDKCQSLGSIDRIDSSKGYEEGNVQWVHKDINRMKLDFSSSRFIELCELVAKGSK